MRVRGRDCAGRRHRAGSGRAGRGTGSALSPVRGSGAGYADNLARLLGELRDVPAPQRTARFRTVAVVHYPDGTGLAAEGVVEGVITTEPRGTGGFGYDPVFAPAEGEGRTFSEMGPAAKHAISHRGRALRALLELLKT